MMDSKMIFLQKDQNSPSVQKKCARMGSHQHSISCYAPPMVEQRAKRLRQLNLVLKVTKAVTPIARVIRYIVQCVMIKTEPYQIKFPTSAAPTDVMIHQAWENQKVIG